MPCIPVRFTAELLHFAVILLFYPTRKHHVVLLLIYGSLKQIFAITRFLNSRKCDVTQKNLAPSARYPLALPELKVGETVSHRTGHTSVLRRFEWLVASNVQQIGVKC